jgi:hypothetical protein
MFQLRYRLNDHDDKRPICPHCEREIDGEVLYFQASSSPTGMKLGIDESRLFACPHCLKVLAITN